VRGTIWLLYAELVRQYAWLAAMALPAPACEAQHPARPALCQVHAILQRVCSAADAQLLLGDTRRDDDENGHYQFEIGDNLAPRFKIMRKFGEGTFGQVPPPSLSVVLWLGGLYAEWYLHIRA
jgi:hypothetical protein